MAEENPTVGVNEKTGHAQTPTQCVKQGFVLRVFRAKLIDRRANWP